MLRRPAEHMARVSGMPQQEWAQATQEEADYKAALSRAVSSGAYAVIVPEGSGRHPRQSGQLFYRIHLFTSQTQG